MAIQFRNVFSILPILLFPFQISAWTTPVNISKTDSSSGRPAICMDKRGWPHCVWEERQPGNYDIYYSFYNGTSWADTLNVSHGLTCWRPDVAADTLNNVHVVWGDYDIGKIMWTMYDGNSWSTPVSISDSVPYSCQGPELDVSPITNYVHCVWHNLGVVDIWHSFYNGDSWSTPENVSNDPQDSAWPDVAVDSIGRIHLVWMDYKGGNDSIEIHYSRFDSISWTTPTNVSRIIGNSCDPRIAIDRDDNPRIVWEERSGGAGYEVHYTYFNGIEWMNPVLLDTDFSSKPDLSIDRDNRVHIVWKHTNGVNDIFYTVYNDTVQEFPPENASNTDSISLGPRVVTDSQYVHLVWGESLGGTSSDANVEIYYSRRLVSGINDKGRRKASFSLPPIIIKKLTLSFSLSEPSSVYISFYDITGKKVEEVSLGFKDKGTHQCSLSLDLPSGIYFFSLKADTYRYRKKFILLNP
ncbi:T9SS type A sorting domain-containing protein [candidate division WOR-3 bacterium]|nr:T9SS type A sorting domain-containing protein [candidate division WOR-3 bacterium]